MAGDTADSTQQDPAREVQKLYDRQWANSILEKSLSNVQNQWKERGNGERLEALLPFLYDEDSKEQLDVAKTARQLNVSQSNFRVILYRLRRDFKSSLRLEVAQTLTEPTPTQIDTEIRILLRSLPESE